MQSTRLPGKVLKKLGGISILEHCLKRCQAIPGVDIVCCAVPDSKANDPVAIEADRIGVMVFRGSEDDVLDRYYQAAKACRADIVMRVTSDCPVVDPEVCGQVIRLLEETGAAYACNNMPPSWPHGLDCEAITFEWLERSAMEAEKKFEREHVTQYVRNHPQAQTENLSGPGGDYIHHRWTIDTPEDFDFFTALCRRLPSGPAYWSYRNILRVLEAEPELALINCGQDRLGGLKKSIRES